MTAPSQKAEPETAAGDQNNDAAAASVRPSARPCPICGKPAVETMRPFCSKRCADVDLHRWLGGVYAIPAIDAEDDPQPAGPGEETP